ncbi:Uncharacterised protein [Tsukamurella paurometabola]|uniref:Uncharacterized protein n=2 Tax=Tsukamurella paurometabola TaxID=2061 RepID=A0A3P8MAV3_TSUPA|nr:Uncharacterised protein [Tsukamurella paurometabola]
MMILGGCGVVWGWLSPPSWLDPPFRMNVGTAALGFLVGVPVAAVVIDTVTRSALERAAEADLRTRLATAIVNINAEVTELRMSPLMRGLRDVIDAFQADTELHPALDPVDDAAEDERHRRAVQQYRNRLKGDPPFEQDTALRGIRQFTDALQGCSRRLGWELDNMRGPLPRFGGEDAPDIDAGRKLERTVFELSVKLRGVKSTLSCEILYPVPSDPDHFESRTLRTLDLFARGGPDLEAWQGTSDTRESIESAMRILRDAASDVDVQLREAQEDIRALREDPAWGRLLSDAF